MGNLRLYFLPERPATFASLADAFALLLQAWGGQPCTWKRFSFESLPDSNAPWGDHRTHKASFEALAGAAQLDESVESGEGDLRDGFGYLSTATMRFAGKSVQYKGGGYDGAFTSLLLEFNGVTTGEFAQATVACQQAWGAEADHSLEPWLAIDNVLALDAAGDHEQARTIAQEALKQAKSGDLGQAALADWYARCLPQQEGLTLRLRQAPALIEGWQLAAQQPPTGWTQDEIAQVLARLCPHEAPGPWCRHPDWPLVAAAWKADEGGPRFRAWRRVDLGLGPGSSLPALPNQLAHAWTGFAVGCDWQEESGGALANAVENSYVTIKRRAAYRQENDAIPKTWVSVHAVWRTAQDWQRPWQEFVEKAPEATVTWHFIAGVATGDFCILVEKSQNNIELGMACLAVGSADFALRVDEALRAATPFRWLACAEDGCFPLTPPPQPEGFDGDMTADPAAYAGLVLAAASVAREPAASLLAACHCLPPSGYCPHQRAMLELQRDCEAAARDATEARRQFALGAAASAWNVAFYALGAQPDFASMRLHADRAARELSQYAALATESDRD